MDELQSWTMGETEVKYENYIFSTSGKLQAGGLRKIQYITTYSSHTQRHESFGNPRKRFYHVLLSISSQKFVFVIKYTVVVVRNKYMSHSENAFLRFGKDSRSGTESRASVNGVPVYRPYGNVDTPVARHSEV